MTTTCSGPRYERVRIDPRRVVGGKAWRQVTLEVTSESETFLSGWEVDQDGDRRARRHIIDKSLIVRRTPLEMDPFYGELVPKGTARKVGE